MCNMMVIERNKATRQYLLKNVKSSRIEPDELFVCDYGVDALQLMSGHKIDIVFVRIDGDNPDGIELAKDIRTKNLFTIIAGYGTCKDFNFLLKAMRSGISYYSSCIYKTNELAMLFNKVYEQHRRQQMELRLEIEKEKESSNKSFGSDLLNEWTTDFCRNAIQNNMEAVVQYIDYICMVMYKQSILTAKRMIIELLVIMAGKFEEISLDLPILPIKAKDYHQIIGACDIDELKKWFNRTLINIAKVAGEILTIDTNSHKLGLAINYIDKNYNRDISRDDVANVIHLTPSYFSQFFKQNMGESFVEYLTRVRIEKAEHLLELTDDHASEISMKVGYNDSKYFAKVFREHTGYTPSEYKKIVSSAQQFAL